MGEDWGESTESKVDKGRVRVALLLCTFCTHRWTCTHTQITAAPLHLNCSVFMMRRTNISMGLGMYIGDRGRREWKGGVKEKRRRSLKYYTYPGKCSVEQALWECKLHSLLLPLGCRLLVEYNHPQRRAPRHIQHCLPIDTSRISDTLPWCVCVYSHRRVQSSIDPTSVLQPVLFWNYVKYWVFCLNWEGINSVSLGHVKHPASSWTASRVVGQRRAQVFASRNPPKNSSLELKQQCTLSFLFHFPFNSLCFYLTIVIQWDVFLTSLFSL